LNLTEIVPIWLETQLDRAEIRYGSADWICAIASEVLKGLLTHERISTQAETLREVVSGKGRTTLVVL
jgi:hypothetical protein